MIDFSRISSIKLPDYSSLVSNISVNGVKIFEAAPLTYELNSDGTAYSVVGCQADAIWVRVPSVHNGLPVTYLTGASFKNCSSLVSIVIPDSVTGIGYAAFSGCSSLTEMTIPFVGAKAGVTSVDTYQYPFGYIFGTSSYTGSYSAKQYYYGDSTSSTTSTTYYIPSSLKSVTITGGNILYGAFDYCNTLTSIVLPSDLTRIGSGAFFGCGSLTSIVIPDSVTSIGDEALEGCSSLTSVTIGNNVTSIGVEAFKYCSSLNLIQFNGSVEKWETISLGNDWNASVPATEVHCSDGNVTIS